MHIHSKAIRYFDAIRRAGSIRAAARELFVDPSAVNRQLLNLERFLGAPLFDRFPDGMQLTQAGEILSQHVITVLQDEQRVVLELGELQGIKRGELRIGCVEGLNTDFLPNVLVKMLQQHPGVSLQTYTYVSQTIAEMVKDADIDIGLAFSVQASPELRCIHSGQFRVGAIMAANHPLALQDEISFRDCAGYPLILPHSHLALRTLIDPLITAQPLTSPVQLHTDSIELMRQLAINSLGVAFHTRFGLDSLVNDGRLVYKTLKEQAPQAKLGIYVRAGRVLPPAVEKGVELLSEAMEQVRQHE